MNKEQKIKDTKSMIQQLQFSLSKMQQDLQGTNPNTFVLNKEQQKVIEKIQELTKEIENYKKTLKNLEDTN